MVPPHLGLARGVEVEDYLFVTIDGGITELYVVVLGRDLRPHRTAGVLQFREVVTVKESDMSRSAFSDPIPTPVIVPPRASPSGTYHRRKSSEDRQGPPKSAHSHHSYNERSSISGGTRADIPGNRCKTRPR